jgi:hypothetical protein
MSDEAALRVAQGLTEEEWAELWWLVQCSQHYVSRLNATLICKDIALLEDKRVYITSLGLRVWEWRDLFCPEKVLAGSIHDFL